MQFQRLKLTGFKSFVDPTEFFIEPGLTGIVGPNGCGKSNLLEGLRWVMGATSAKAMRGAGMDDVIFAGADKRPARNWAEVTLLIDNADRRAPQPFTDQASLEVARRIDRGAGSTYRVNGKEVRARDVQLLFADASTGANSPALVRQGQISELIASKPQNRRRVLEEAGGVSGLHTRRHEAELRLKAAEANLARLEDISGELDTALSRLKREARQAEKYKKLSAEIRALQSALLYARWLEADTALQAAQSELQTRSRTVEEATREAGRTQTLATEAFTALGPLKEEDAVSATVLHRLSLEKERLEMEAEQAAAEVVRLKAEQTRLIRDLEREQEVAHDAATQLERLSSHLERVRAEIAATPSRLPALQAALDKAEAAQTETATAVEALASKLAAETARQNADAARLRDAESRATRAKAAVDQARREREAIGPLETPALAEAESRFQSALEALNAARARLDAAETARSEATPAEAEARQQARQLEDRLGRLTTESRGLAQLLTPARRDHAPALDQVRADKGYEVALAAALGEDLNAALDPAALSYWGGADAPPHHWPEGVVPLSQHVRAPDALKARLDWVGVILHGQPETLRVGLPVGARLVTPAGDLWRWDGFVDRADAPKPAATRLAQRTRFDELEQEIDRLRPEAEAAQAAHQAAIKALRETEEALKAARAAPLQAEREVGQAREARDRLAQERARREARALALDETLARLNAEAEAADAALTQTRGDMTAPADTAALNTALSEAREQAKLAREAVQSARAALDTETRERQAREGRERNLGRELADWTRRAEDARQRVGQLDQDQVRTRGLLEVAIAAPEAMATRKAGLLDQFELAEQRRSKARDDLAAAETAARAADQAARQAETLAAQSREHRASALAHFEAAGIRRTEAESHLREQTHLSPEDLGKKLREDAIAIPADASGAESLLGGLERERDLLGAVNLRAEEEASEYQDRLDTLKNERMDLVNAIAKLRDGIDELNAEGRERLLAAFDVINAQFKTLFVALFGGGQAELRLIESDDPLEAGLEIYACPPGKRLSIMSLMSGGEQALTATALIFAVFLANPAPVCVLDEVDAPLDDANVDRYCRLLDEMRTRTQTRFIVITHNPVTMSRMDRLFGVTMAERGVSQLVSVDLKQAEALVSD